jgi:rubrerythrin
MYSSEEVIELAVNVETNGERFYSESARRAEGSLKKIFEFLAKQEDFHRLKFESLRKYANDFILPRDWEEIEPYLNVIVESTFFMGNEKSFKKAMEAKDSVEALEFALQFEKDTLLFFNEIVEISGEQSKKVVNEIIKEEKKHIEMISELLREHRV